MVGRCIAWVGANLTVALGSGAVGAPVIGPVPVPGGRGAAGPGFERGTVGAPVSTRGAAAGAAGFWASGRVAAGRPAVGGATGRAGGAVGAPAGLGAVGAPGGLGAVGADGRAKGGTDPDGAGADGAGAAATGMAEVVLRDGGAIGGAGSFTGAVLALGAGGGSGAEGN